MKETKITGYEHFLNVLKIRKPIEKLLTRPEENNGLSELNHETEIETVDKINRRLWDSDAEEKAFRCLQSFINEESFFIVPHILVSEVIKEFRKYDYIEDTYNRYCQFIKEERKQTHFELMHFDFVIFNKKDCFPVLIIEVDGANHKTNQTTRHFDKFKDFMAQQYEIPMARLDLFNPNVDIEGELKSLLMSKKLNEPQNYPVYCYRCGRKFSYRKTKNVQERKGFYFCDPCQRNGLKATLSCNERICPPIFVWDK